MNVDLSKTNKVREKNKKNTDAFKVNFLQLKILYLYIQLLPIIKQFQEDDKDNSKFDQKFSTSMYKIRSNIDCLLLD